MPPRQRPLADRLWAKVDRSAGPEGCWPFTGYRDKEGYGKIGRGGHDGGVYYAHRVAFFLEHGRWPAETTDHLCEFKACCNPAHLEDVPNQVNCIRARGFCKQGHPLDGPEADVRITKPNDRKFPRRVCGLCARIRDRARWPKRAAARRERAHAG